MLLVGQLSRMSFLQHQSTLFSSLSVLTAIFHGCPVETECWFVDGGDLSGAVHILTVPAVTTDDN